MHGCGDWTPERRPTLRAAPLRLGRLLRSHPKLRSTTLRVGKIGEPPGITIAHLTLLDYTDSGNTSFGSTNPGDGQQRVTVSSGARRGVPMSDQTRRRTRRSDPTIQRGDHRTLAQSEPPRGCWAQEGGAARGNRVHREIVSGTKWCLGSASTIGLILLSFRPHGEAFVHPANRR